MSGIGGREYLNTELGTLVDKEAVIRGRWIGFVINGEARQWREVARIVPFEILELGVLAGFDFDRWIKLNQRMRVAIRVKRCN